MVWIPHCLLAAHQHIPSLLPELPLPCTTTAPRSLTTIHRALNSLVLESVPVVWIRRCYVLKATGAAATDPLRQVVVELLADRDSIQKKDIATAAALKGVAMTDGAYSKVGALRLARQRPLGCRPVCGGLCGVCSHRCCTHTGLAAVN